VRDVIFSLDSFFFFVFFVVSFFVFRSASNLLTSIESERKRESSTLTVSKPTSTHLGLFGGKF
jgi:hypothetical protein